MRRLVSIAAFALLLTVPVWAQHGGGGHGGGHAGFGGGHAGGFSGHGGGFGGGHFSGGSGGVSSFHGGVSSFHGGARGFSNPSRFSSSRGPFLHDGFGRSRFRTFGFRNFGYRNNCRGWGCRNWGWGYGYPWWGSAYYDPWWWWQQDDREFDDDYYRQYDIANEMNRQSLEQQRMLRQEEADGDQDAYAPRHYDRSQSQAAASSPQGTPLISPTVLVFRDHHQQEVQNYAIVGQTLWNFAPQHTQKIALADLDLPATEKANDDRGVTFRVPGTNEGQ